MSVSTGSLEAALVGMIELRPFPAAASQLMTACNDTNATVREVTEIIKSDPGLSTRLLQLANSPMYGFSVEIRSIDHATVVLGMRALRDLAVSTAVGDVFDAGDAATTKIRQDLWQYSLAVGCVARLLAADVEDVVPDEAFLGGVIHDVGKLFILDHDSVGYIQLLSGYDLTELPAAEIETYGLAHTEVGQRCAQFWGLPDEIIDVIRFHHDPEEADFGGALVDVVFAANYLVTVWFAGAELTISLEDVIEPARLETTPDKLDSVRQTEETLETMSAVCS